jgi:hypothetical protein
MDVDYFNALVLPEMFSDFGYKDIHTPPAEVIVISPYGF